MKDPQAVSSIIEELKNLYPDAVCSLTFDPDKAYELLFSVRLAAQCTDARVNLVTPILPLRRKKWGRSSILPASGGPRPGTS